jgi:hypothetical protein
MKNPSNQVHLTLPKSQQTTRISNVNMNPRHVFRTLSRHALNCILLDCVLLCCPGFLLFHYTSYYINLYILLSTFPTSLYQTWNLRLARWGITIHRRINKHTFREHLHMYSRRQPIFIPNQMFQLSNQLSSISLEIAIIQDIILIKKDDDDTDRMISNDDC